MKHFNKFVTLQIQFSIIQVTSLSFESELAFVKLHSEIFVSVQ